MTEVVLSRGSAVPLYQQLKQHLLREIEAGVLQPHSRLPSERELVQELGVSRITVRQALGELIQQGYLYTAPGKGVYIAERPPAFELTTVRSFSDVTRIRGRRPGSRVLEATLVAASGSLARELLISPSAEVVSLTRLRLIDDVPVMIQHSWLPHARCPGLLDQDFTDRSLYAELRERYGIRPTRGDMTISARLASAQERAWLELSGAGVVLTQEQVAYTEDTRPAEFSLSVVNPERHPFSLSQQLP
jgi:GntR family transcriptional regulator